MTIHDVLVRPLVTEKGVTRRKNERTLCFRGGADANKTQVKQAVEKLFKVKVRGSAHGDFEGKLRRRGRFAGYRSDWKSLREARGGPEGARVRGDVEIQHGDQEITRPTTPSRRLQTVVSREDITKETPEKSLVEPKQRSRAAATTPAASLRASSAAATSRPTASSISSATSSAFRRRWRRSNTIPTVRRASRC